jgi:hypothetical protein
MRLLHRSLLISLLALPALPVAADAAVFCAPAPCAEGTPQTTIKDAVMAADTAPGPDTVAIGPGIHNLGEGQFVGQPDTDVRGAGIDETILTGDDFPASDPGTGRSVISGYMSRLADLTLRIPSAVTAGNSSAEGADVYNGLVENVKIDARGSTFGPGPNDGSAQAMLIRGGEVHGLEVDLAPDIDASGVQVIGGIELADVKINSPQPFDASPQASPDPLTVRARRFRVTSTDPISASDGFLVLSDSVIDVSSAPPGAGEGFVTGVEVFDGRPPEPAGLTLDRVTLVGNGDATAAALSVAGQGAAPPTFIRARHLLASGFGRALAYQNFGSNPTATIDFSNLPQGPGTIINTGPGPATLGGDQATANRGGDPMLLDDLSLPFGSPAVDIGGADLIPGEATDLAGNPRPADGDGNGSIRNDAGAFERAYTPDGATLKIKGKRVKLNRKGRGKIALACPPATKQPSPCTAKLTLKTARKVGFKGGKRKLTLAKAKQVKIRAAKTKKAKVRIKGAKLRLLRDSKEARKARAKVKVTDGNGERGTVAKKLKLKPQS